MVSDIDRQDLHRAVDDLPASELAAAFRYLKYLSLEAADEEPIDAQTAAELDEALAEQGETISFEEVRHRLGL